MPDLRIGSLCTGYGGLDTATQAVFGGTTTWVADNDPGASKILAHHWPDTPNHGDITTTNWADVEPVDIATMGFPCQDVSLAGRGIGIKDGTRSGLWRHCARAIAHLNPKLVIIENVRGLLSRPAHSHLEHCPWCMGNPGDEPVLRALGAVLGDLADLGFDAEWIGLPACDPRIGGPSERWREFILAWPAAPHPDFLRWNRRPRNQPETPRRHEPADRRHPLPTGPVNLLPTPAARDWKSGASNLMDANSRPLNEFAVNWLPRRGDWIGTNGIDYGPAIRRWEDVTGHPAPEPTQAGPRGGRRLNPAFPEWMQGIDPGHVTAVPDLSYSDQLRAIGNGVVWRQAELAIRLAADRVATSLLTAAALTPAC